MKTAIVVTSINPPTDCMKSFSEGALKNDNKIVVVADKKSPADYDLPGVTYLTVDEQLSAFPKLASALPFNTYARKNIGYLWTFKNGYEKLIDTDDDNAPYEDFWINRTSDLSGDLVGGQEWVNAYAYFTEKQIWPRGFPLDAIQEAQPAVVPTDKSFYCPIQQGLANENPDVDAIYRLVLPLPFNFDDRSSDLILDEGAWCPFNSQNTNWWAPAFPLTYLPSYCNFRMTDIWRSFVAQRVLWANDWRLAFYKATVYQDRNEHSLIGDFEDEIPGYLENRKICSTLAGLDLKSGQEHIKENLFLCYQSLVEIGSIGKEELPLLEAWIAALP